jgi:hypothetical protein
MMIVRTPLASSTTNALSPLDCCTPIRRGAAIT